MRRRHFLKASALIGLGSHLDPLETFAVGASTEDIPIIDTHMHLWDLQKLRYPWLEGQGLPLEQDFLVANYQRATQDCSVTKAVFIECGVAPAQYLEEVDWVVELSRTEPRIQGIVSYLPVEKGPLAIPELELLVTRSLVKGIRRGVNRALMHDARFIQGLQLLPDYNLSFDLNIVPPLMPEALTLIRQCPETLFILDHLCNPNVREKELNPWKAHLSELARLENVYCKVSGIITKADEQQWTPDDVRPYVLHALEAFGIDRVLFGGDWPVVLRAGSYRQWLSALQQITDDLSEDEKRRLFYRNAEQVYRL